MSCLLQASLCVSETKLRAKLKKIKEGVVREGGGDEESPSTSQTLNANPQILNPTP